MGHSAICSLLLDFGESVDASSIDGDTALIKAASCGNLSTVSGDIFLLGESG